MSEELTRRRFIRGAAAGITWLALAAATGCDLLQNARSKPSPGKEPLAKRPDSVSLKETRIGQSKSTMAFRSRPDLTPPLITVETPAQDTADGYIFVAPKKGQGQYGAMILDNRGQTIWFRPVQNKGNYAMDFKVQRYHGQPVLTWAEGKVVGGHGVDEYVILDASYREITRFGAGNGFHGDHHEFLITPQDTAMITIYSRESVDLSSVGGLKENSLLVGLIQEINIETGEVIFQWRSLDHVGINESYARPSDDYPSPFDYFHINSIDVEPDGNLIVSSRRASAIYKIDRRTGELIWRLGGKKSDFEMGEGTRTLYQHDARRHPDGTLTVFDNGGVHVSEQSRAIVLDVDEGHRTVTLKREYTHPDKILAATQGSMRILPNDNVFVGWGDQPTFSEFGEEGKLLFSANFPTESESYRAFRFPWRGNVEERPAVIAERTNNGEVEIYVSWNGATEVASWQALAGSKPGKMAPVGSVPKDGFETVIKVRTSESYVGVRALDHSGQVLDVSEPIKLRD